MIICRQPIHRLFLGLHLESTVTESGALSHQIPILSCKIADRRHVMTLLCSLLPDNLEELLLLQPNPNPIRQCEMTVRNPVYEVTLEKTILRIARSSHCIDIAANFAAVLSELKACGEIVVHCGEQVNYSQMYVVGCDSWATFK